MLLALAGGGEPLLHPTAPALRTVSAALDPDDLPILGMLVHGTRPADVATTLGIGADALRARRWAILRRLTPRRASRAEPHAGRYRQVV